MTLAGLSWSVSGQLMGRSLRFELRVSGGRVAQATFAKATRKSVQHCASDAS